jgi:hypothetical protein
MMNSDIYSSVLAGHKMIIVVCDNGGFAVINRLQNFKGGASFNNLIRDSRVKEPFGVDFVKHAQSMGALGRAGPKASPIWSWRWSGPRRPHRTTVISIATDAFIWTQGNSVVGRRRSRSQRPGGRAPGAPGPCRRPQAPARGGVVSPPREQKHRLFAKQVPDRPGSENCMGLP